MKINSILSCPNYGWCKALLKGFVLLVCCTLFGSQASAAANRIREAPQQPDPSTTLYLSIPAAAFHPEYDFLSYYNNGRRLKNDYSGGHYVAPVELPVGSTINKITFYYEDTSSEDWCQLTFRGFSWKTLGVINYASLVSTGWAGFGSIYTPVDWEPVIIEDPAYSYYLDFMSQHVLTVTDLMSVLIEYTPSAVQPTSEWVHVAPAGFVSSSDSFQRVVSQYIMNIDSEPSGKFQAPVFLPDGAEAIEANFFYNDRQDKDISAHLYRANLAGSWDPNLPMVDLASSGKEGFGDSKAGIARYSKIQNEGYLYWVNYDMPLNISGENIAAYGFAIRYARGTSYPVQAVSIPAAAFTPSIEDQTYFNAGPYLNASGLQRWFYAPVYLPQGKYIHQVRFCFEKLGSPFTTATATLNLVDRFNNQITITQVSTAYIPATGWTCAASEVLQGFQVNNQLYSYYLQWELPPIFTDEDHISPSGVVIELHDSAAMIFLPLAQKK